jgi:hypothetical protein
MTAAGRAPAPRRRRLVAALVALVAVCAAAGVWVVQRRPDGQGLRIDGGSWAASAPSAPRPRTARAGDPPYLTSVAPGGRYFLDQFGEPFLVRGDSPWSLLTRLSPAQARLWFDDRRRHGVNAAIVSLIGATDNGGPSDDGATDDGLRPFVDGDILAWQEPYWQRVTAYLRMAADAGITVLLYPIDGWTIGHAVVPRSVEQCGRYGTKVAERFRDLPNIVWMTGGDYFPATDDPARGSDVDRCLDAMLRGIRAAGDERPFSIQLGYDKSLSTENPYWAARVGWNFVYTYYPTYRAVLEAYAHRPALPAVMGEANYAGENNQPDTADTTDETLRRQVLWALTSGAAGEFGGTADWQFRPGWEQRLASPAAAQTRRLRDVVAALPWWRLVPDVDGTLVTGGRGTPVTTDTPTDVLASDYATAARTPDGRVALVYVPTARTLTLDLAALAPDVRAEWIDPVSGTRRPAALSTTMITPGAHPDGTADWLLLLRSPPSPSR